MAWVMRLRRVVPVTTIAVERVRFDMQLLEKKQALKAGVPSWSFDGLPVFAVGPTWPITWLLCEVQIWLGPLAPIRETAQNPGDRPPRRA
jgi:hypothetical protein